MNELERRRKVAGRLLVGVAERCKRLAAPPHRVGSELAFVHHVVRRLENEVKAPVARPQQLLCFRALLDGGRKAEKRWPCEHEKELNGKRVLRRQLRCERSQAMARAPYD